MIYEFIYSLWVLWRSAAPPSLTGTFSYGDLTIRPNVDSRGLDSSRILILRGGILMSKGNRPESLGYNCIYIYIYLLWLNKSNNVSGDNLSREIGRTGIYIPCMYVCMCIYIYIYIYICMCVYTNTKTQCTTAVPAWSAEVRRWTRRGRTVERERERERSLSLSLCIYIYISMYIHIYVYVCI